MKHWSRSLALIAVVLGVVGEGAAIASTSSSNSIQISPQISQSNFTSIEEIELHVAQFFPNQNLGRRGECRVTIKNIPLFTNRAATAIRQTLPRGTEVILLEDSGNLDYIAVQTRNSTLQGFVDTNNLERRCSSTSFPTPVLPGNTTFPSQQPTQCLISRSAGRGLPVYEELSANANFIDEVLPGTQVRVIQQVNDPNTGTQWTEITFPGVRGWIISGNVRQGISYFESCL